MHRKAIDQDLIGIFVSLPRRLNQRKLCNRINVIARAESLYLNYYGNGSEVSLNLDR